VRRYRIELSPSRAEAGLLVDWGFFGTIAPRVGLTNLDTRYLRRGSDATFIRAMNPNKYIRSDLTTIVC